MSAVETLIVPGWGNSGPGHWQTLWSAELPNTRRVEQREWVNVAVGDWVQTLDTYIRDSKAPVVLVAHSLACVWVAHWASRGDTSRIRAALLVAPTDVEDTSTVPPKSDASLPFLAARFP